MTFSGKDVEYMTETLAEVGSWVEQPVTVFVFGSVTYSGTTVEAGDPPTLTFGTRTSSARIERLKANMIERSDGVYQMNDRSFAIRGSFSQEDMLVHEAGTYRPIEGPVKYFMGSNLFYQATCREVKT